MAPQDFLEQLAIDIDAFIDRYHGLPLGELNLAAMLLEVATLLRVHRLALPADLALLVFGVNDTTHLTASKRWQQALAAMADALAAQGCRLAFSAVPPLQHFSALPWLLRQLMGWRAGLLDAELRGLSQRLGAMHCALDLPFEAHYLAEDGYHPSALGYRQWAAGLAERLTPSLQRSA